MAGPWFTVHQTGSDWQDLGSVWISDGATDQHGMFQIRVELLPAPQSGLLSLR
ncbi:hypothetical protein [Lignipirellula cremea]|uniref:Uncharacterized protein n=1 Tax=Lignipirellula cremea TaxID=2528010 RepID=A0A518DP94_9BACT|nr:hypothetical protein [Lignipirellula cremea]QDU93661.1 hypothetical protein Pla8534_14420 [Lignipirellula cremea]